MGGRSADPVLLKINGEARIGAEAARAAAAEMAGGSVAIEPPRVADEGEANRAVVARQLRHAQPLQVADRTIVRPDAVVVHAPAALDCQLHRSRIGARA